MHMGDRDSTQRLRERRLLNDRQDPVYEHDLRHGNHFIHAGSILWDY